MNSLDLTEVSRVNKFLSCKVIKITYNKNMLETL